MVILKKPNMGNETNRVQDRNDKRISISDRNIVFNSSHIPLVKVKRRQETAALT